MRLLLPSIALTWVAALAGCGGEKLDVGSSSLTTPGPSATTTPPTPPAPSSTVLPGATAPPFGPADIATAEARCAEPHGNADVPPSIAAFKERFVGDWYVCDGQSAPWTKGGLGIDLGPRLPTDPTSASGHVFGLTKDPSGNLVRATGLDMEAAYSLAPATTTDVTPGDDSVPYSQMFVYPDGHTIEFETAPRRMRIDGKLWLVPIGATGG